MPGGPSGGGLEFSMLHGTVQKPCLLQQSMDIQPGREMKAEGGKLLWIRELLWCRGRDSNPHIR